MKPETPAKSITKIMETTNCSAHRIMCDCSTSAHDVDIWIEVEGDAEFQELMITFYAKLYTTMHDSYFNRIKLAWKLLTTGYIELDHSLLLNEQGATNVANTINSEITRLKSNQP